MTLISVKSKYGSCKGTCMGWIIFNKKKKCIEIYIKPIVECCSIINNKYIIYGTIWFESRYGLWKIQKL